MTFSSMRVLAVLLCACAVGAAWAADWPGFRGARRDGIAPERGINKAWKAKAPKTLWTVAMSDFGFSGPSVAGGKLYTLSRLGLLHCLDAATGKKAWACDLVMAAMSPAGYTELGRIKPLGGQSWTAPIIADGRLYMRNKSTLACLDLK